MSNHSFAVIDLETTGFSNSDRIIEVGVVLTDPAGRVEKRWRTLVQPNRGFDNGFVHGITASDLVQAPQFEDIALRLADLLNGRVVVAHNASFEKWFLSQEFARAGLQLPEDGTWLLDTLRAAKGILPGPSHKLAACLESIGVTNAAAHTALADADATACLLEYMLPWMTDDLAAVEPLVLDDFDLAVLPASTAPLLVRDDGLFGEDSEGTEGGGREEDGDAGTDEWMRRITDAAPGIGDEAADQYMALLADAMVDHRLDDDEVAQLLATAHALELSDDDVAELHELYLKQVSIEAWADGVVTPEEREQLLTIADELSVGRATASVWLAEPLGTWRVVRRDGGDTGGRSGGTGEGTDGDLAGGIHLSPGDRVTFTGAMAIPREEWARRATAAGLDVGGVCKRSRVVVAADVASRSGKAERARELGVPVIGEREFAKALAEMAAPQTTAPEAVASEGAAPEGSVPVVDADGGADTAFEETVALDLGRIFPWLADVPETRADAAGIVESWLTFRPDVPLHAMSPVLAPPTRPDGVDVTLKTTMTWFTEFPEPLAASVEDLRELRHVGRVKLRSFVYATVLQAIDDAELLDGDAEVGEVVLIDVDPYADDVYGDDAYGVDAGAVDDPFASRYDIYGESATSAVGELDADEIVSGWVALMSGWPSASDETWMQELPEVVRDAVDDAADPAERIFNRALAEIDEAIGVNDPRRAAIVEGRIAGGKTLEELGNDFGVSRERVRQLESALIDDLRGGGPACALIHSAIASRFGPCAPIDTVIEALPLLGERPDTVSSPLLDLLPVVVEGGGPSWRVDGGWLVVGDIDDRIAEAIATNADDYGVVDPSTAAGDVGLTVGVLSARLRATSNYEIRESVILTKVGSIPDRAAAELVLAGEPLTTVELAELIPDRSRRSIANALSTSELTRRCAVDTWSLAEWGREEWTSIVDFMKRRIAESESGAVSLERLVVEAEQFGVKGGSVNAYAATPEFTVEDGMVRLTENLDEIDISATPEESKGLYLRDGSWSLLVTVTRDHLRGSGSGIPGGVVAVHGLRYGRALELPSRLGPQRLSWMGNTTTTGTISRFMADLECVEGDRVWLVFGDEFDVVPATDRKDGLTGAAELLNATGLDDLCAADAEVEEVLAVVNEAIDLPADAARRKTVSRLRHRRDEDLAELVREL